MKNASRLNLKLSAISLGVIALMAAGAALADDEELKALTQPKSSVQVEMIGVDQNSSKFGEYNGLYGHPSGAYPNGALEVRGGSAYTNNQEGDTTRWSVTGDNLGLTTRSANASIANQGSWNFGVNFDQLQHNTGAGYQTPYNGSNGGASFTLPSNVNGTTNNNPTLARSLQPMQISNTRNNTTAYGTAVIDANSNITFEYNNLLQSGAKLGAFSSAGGSPKEIVSILPMPVSSTTDTVNLAYNWKGLESHFTASYFGSFFQNANSAVSIQPYNNATSAVIANQTLSLAPSNAFNQVNLGGGYDFTSKTKLTANASVGQNTQNQGFGGTYDSMMVAARGLPQASMNGLVNTTHADVKVTDQSVKDLVLTAGAKFDQRDNLSQSNIYGVYSIGSQTSNMANLPNTPMSIKQLNLLLSGDYKIDKSQKINLAYNNDAVNRWCNQYGGTSGLQITPYGPAQGVQTAATTNSFNSSSNCASATSSNENRLSATYKLKATEDLNFKMTAGYADRKTQWDQNVIAAMPYSTAATYSPTQPMGYNSGNQLGFMPFFEASRKQYIAKASSNWQATDAWMLSLSGKYTNDLYPDSKYGVQNGNSWSLNLDSTFVYAEEGTFTAYATQQNQSRSLTNLYGYYGGPTGTTVVTNTTGTPYAWNNTLQNNTTTVGLNLKQGGLADGKLTLIGDLMTSFARSQYTTSVPYQTTVGAAGACTAPTSGATCGITPGIQNNLAAIKLTGIYQLDKNQKIGLAYWYQHLYSNDYYYNGYSYGSTPAVVVPTNQTSPSYSVNVISANYTYTFD